MEMSQDCCRLCLKTYTLKPIFVDTSRCDRYSTVLALTTGLQIHENDGMPQKICRTCTKSVNLALKLRNQSFLADKQLLRGGFKRNAKSKIKKVVKENGGKGGKGKKEAAVEIVECKTENDKSLDEITLPDFEVEVEFDRLTDELKPEDFTFDLTKLKVKSPELKKTRRNKKRKEEYLALVDGVLDPKGPVTCKICKKVLSTWATFVGHIQIHLGFKFVCEFCGKSFISTTQLLRHCRSKHGLERTLRCPHCEYMALDNAQLVLHSRRAHSGLRPFSCRVCSASYHSRRCLAQHLESHATSATVQCTQCPQLFKSRRHLARHKYAAHTCKQYTYRCPLCAQHYRSRKYVAVHVRRAHGEAAGQVRITRIKL